MIRLSSKVSAVFALLGLAACGAAPAPAPPPAANSASPRDDLRRIVDRYWEERAPPGNPLSPQFMADTLAAERRFLADLQALPRARLAPAAALTYDIFQRRRALEIHGLTLPR